MPLSKINKIEDGLDTPDIYKQDMLHKFIISAGFEQFKLQAIPGDASKREYYRVVTLNNTYILMDASKDLASIKPFISIDNLLLNLKVRAPVIIKFDADVGLILLEDFGQFSFTKYLLQNPENELLLYSQAIEVLSLISKINYELQLPQLNDRLLNSELSIFCDWYVSKVLPPGIAKKISQELYAIFNQLYKNLDVFRETLVVRDYMADNLFWLDGATEENKVGVIDFQDAVLGSPVYDLVSLLEDARRDVSPKVVKNCKLQFLDIYPHVQKEDFENIYSILGAQRNIKIIGIFHRLNLRDGKSKYLEYLPRVWAHLYGNLQNPNLKVLKNWFDKYDLFQK